MKKGKAERIDEEFLKDMQEMAKIRILKGFANPHKKNEISLREMTSLARRTESYQKMLDELKTKPKKR